MLRRFKSGFTLVELLLAVFILVLVIWVELDILPYRFTLGETSRNRARALSQVRSVVEDIRNTTFDNVVATYNNRTVDLIGMNGLIRSEAALVPGSNGNLINVRVIAGWVQSRGRVIGEGVIGGAARFVFADLNLNTIIESPIEIVTAINRE